MRVGSEGGNVLGEVFKDFSVRFEHYVEHGADVIESDSTAGTPCS